jgi:hypothetical protein
MKDAQMIIPHFELTIVVFDRLSSLLIAPQICRTDLQKQNKLVNVFGHGNEVIHKVTKRLDQL